MTRAEESRSLAVDCVGFITDVCPLVLTLAEKTFYGTGNRINDVSKSHRSGLPLLCLNILSGSCLFFEMFFARCWFFS